MPFFALLALLCSFLCGCSHQEASPIQLPEPPPAEEAESLPQPNWVDGEWVYGYVEPPAEPDPAPEHQEPATWPLGQGLIFVYEQRTWEGETWLMAREVESDLCWPLVKEGHFIAELPGGVVYRTKADLRSPARYYYHDAATGLRQPLDIASMWRYAVQDGKLYFSTTNVFSCFDPATGSITHPLPNGADMFEWCLLDGILYYLDSQNGFHRAALDGEDVLLFHYDNEGIIDRSIWPKCGSPTTACTFMVSVGITADGSPAVFRLPVLMYGRKFSGRTAGCPPMNIWNSVRQKHPSP